MKKRLKLDRLIRIMASFLIIVLLMSFAGAICNHPNDLVENTTESFYAEENDSLDYVILGSSAAQCAVFPTVIYRDYGLTGYDMCVDGCNSKIYLSILKEIEAHQKNAIIIVDMDGFTYLSENKGYNSSSFWIDSMNKNKNWLTTIRRVERDNTVEHIIPILKYHKNITSINTWKSFIKGALTENEFDIIKGANYLNEERLPANQMNNLVQINTDNIKSEDIPNDREVLLHEFLEYCKKQKLNVVFCDFPKAYCDDKKHESLSKYESRSKYCKEIIEEYGFNYYNSNDSEFGLNFSKNEFADSFHLNYTGAIRYSKWLGNIISSTYTFTQKSEHVIDNWNLTVEKAYEKYNL